MRRRILMTGWVLAVSVHLAAVDAAAQTPPPRDVPAKLVPVLNAAQRAIEADDAAAAVRILSSWEGEDDPLRQLLLGYAYADLEQDARAAEAFRAALALDPELEKARTALARSLSRLEDWPGVVEALRGAVDVEESSAALIGLYARAAFEQGDHRLAALLVERGILRFPDDVRLRRLDLAVLLEREAWSEAAEAAIGLLGQEPNDPLVWRQLAAALQRSDGALALAAMEASSLAAPGRAAVAHAARLLEEGAFEAAARLLQEDEAPEARAVRAAAAVRSEDTALAGPLPPESVPDAPEAKQVAARRAFEAGDPSRMRALAERGRLPASDLVDLGARLLDSQPQLAVRYLETVLAQCGPAASRAAAELADAQPRRAAALQSWLDQCGSADE